VVAICDHLGFLIGRKAQVFGFKATAKLLRQLLPRALDQLVAVLGTASAAQHFGMQAIGRCGHQRACCLDHVVTNIKLFLNFASMAVFGFLIITFEVVFFKRTPQLNDKALAGFTRHNPLPMKNFRQFNMSIPRS
jgi:hypothetical protein